MADQTQRLEIATVRAEVGSNIVYRFANDAAAAAPIPTESGDIQNLKQVILEIQAEAAEKISISTTIYPTVADGLVATPDQSIFLVQSNDADEIYTVWKNESGTAVNTGKTALSATAIQTALDASNEAAQAAENAADVAIERTARYLAPSATPPTVRDDGLPLEIGDIWFSTVDQTEYRYTDTGWQANESQQAIADIEDSNDPSKGAAKVGFEGESVASVLLQVKPILDYAELRAYSGGATRAQLTKPGIAGAFNRRLAAPGETEKPGITIISTGGTYAWDRDFQGDVQASWFGVVPGDSTGRYLAQVQSAINYVASTRGRLSLTGDIYIEAGLAFPSSTEYHIDASKARFIVDASAPFGAIVGSSGSNPFRGTIQGLDVEKASPGLPGTGGIGIWLLNSVEADIEAPIVKNFSKSMAYAPASGSRVAYNKISNPAFTNHEYGVWIQPADDTSYANENTITAGRFASFVAGRLIDQVYISNLGGQGAQHNRFLGISLEGYSSSGFCGKSAARVVNGAHQNIFEWCRTEKYNDGWEDGTYVFDDSTLGNLVLDTRSDVIFVDQGQNNWWTPITGFHFTGFQSNQAASPAFKYTRSAPLSNVATKYAIDLADTYAASGEVGLLRYTSARGGGTLIDIATTLGALRMNGACEWTTPSRRSGAVTGASSHGYSVAASVTGATLCAAYHSLKSNEAGSWFLYGEGNAPSYFGGPIRTVGTLGISPATAYTGALWFSNTSSNTGGVASEYQTNNVATRHHVAFSNPNGVVGSISTNANSTAFNTSSDRDKKKNIEDASDSGEDIDAIRVAQFDWKSNGDHQPYGFIAQELVEIAPYAVSHDPESPGSDWSVDYSKLVPMMMKEIQMLRERVKRLEE